MGTILVTFPLLALSVLTVTATAIGPAIVALGLLLCVTNAGLKSQPTIQENS